MQKWTRFMNQNSIPSKPYSWISKSNASYDGLHYDSSTLVSFYDHALLNTLHAWLGANEYKLMECEGLD
jgi:hypothetical protein